MRVGRPTVDLADDALEFPSIIHALDFAAENVPERIALICGENSINFVRYRRAVSGMATMLSKVCSLGDRVAVLMDNSIDMAIALMGSMTAGAQIAPLNPSLTERELFPLLNDIDARALLCDAGSEQYAHQLASKIGIKHVYSATRDFDIWAFAADENNRLPSTLPTGDMLAAMFFTGGTTGLPKGAEHTHHSVSVFAPLIHALWKFRFDE